MESVTYQPYYQNHALAAQQAVSLTNFTSKNLISDLTVADPEICLRGPDDSRNLRPAVVAIFFFTSFNRGKGGRASGTPLDPLLSHQNTNLIWLWRYSVFSLGLQATDVSLDARVTELEENGGGSRSNGMYVLSDYPLKIPIFILTFFFFFK